MFSPMLASKCKDINELRFPVLATPKLDGIRAVKLGGTMYARSLKPIRSYHVQALCANLPDGLDGELMCGENFQDTESGVMSYDKVPDFKYWVFDWIDQGEMPYSERIAYAEQQLRGVSLVEVVTPELIRNLDELETFVDTCLEQGYEGVITRTPDSPYLYKRSTWTQQYMVKHKPLESSEAVILALEEGETNLNPQVPNIFGRMKRPGGRRGGEGRAPRGTLGSFFVRDIHTGVEFKCGNGKGLDHALRARIWADQTRYIGAIIRYTYQKSGTKHKPRIPQFAGFRDLEDL